MDTHNKHKPQAISETHTPCPWTWTGLHLHERARNKQPSFRHVRRRLCSGMCKHANIDLCVCVCVGGGATVCISLRSTKTLQRFLRTDVCTYAYLYFIYIRRCCTYAYLYACMCACACVQTYMHTCVRAPYIHTYIHAYMLTYTQTCIHTCTHTCTHTHTHTFMQDAGEVGSSWGGGEARTAVGVAAADKLDLGTAAEDSFSDDDPACVE